MRNILKMQKSKIKNQNRQFLKNKNYQIKTGSGFTLVETMVAITVLLLAIVGPMTLAQQGISSSRASKNQITAYYLAQEAFEYVRNQRDYNILNGKNLLFGLANCLGDSCIIDSINDDVSACGASCDLLRESPEGLFGYDGSWTETDFRRKVFIVPSGMNSDEIVVEVTMSWDNDTKTFMTKESLFDTR